MSIKQIRVTIKPDGTTTVDAENFQGVGCKAATEALALAVTGSNSPNRKDDPKAEYYVSDSQEHTL